MTTPLNPQRRRGDDLETAVFAAAYQLLATEGYQAVTFSKIAVAANTSRSVLYRHWDTPFELLFAAMHAQLANADVQLPSFDFDDGSLRANLLHSASEFSDLLASMLPEFNRMMITEMTAHSKAIQKLLATMQLGNLEMIDYALQLALQHGELTRMPPETTRLALFQIIRYRSVIENHRLTATDLTAIVDDVVLPAILKTGH
mgnify:CR=1 FL=1